MVINDRRKVIFIHIPKTGGISVEKSIHKALGGDDYILYKNLINIPSKYEDKKNKGLFLHSTMKDYRRYYGTDISNFYIFSIVRNPWRRLVSHYEYLIKPGFNKRINDENEMDFSQFIQIYQTRLLGYTLHGYKDFLEDDYGTQLNRVIKLESINDDLPIVGDEIKLEIKEVLHMNPTDEKLRDHENWKDYYNPGLRDRVYKLYKDDIEKYGYEFEE